VAVIFLTLITLKPKSSMPFKLSSAVMSEGMWRSTVLTGFRNLISK
jgi:hypothetical protein